MRRWVGNLRIFGSASTQPVRSRSTFFDMHFAEFDNPRLGPKSFLTAFMRNKCTMPAVFRRQQCNRLLAGDIQVDAQALGLGAAAKARVLANPTLQANSDAALTGRAWFAYLNTKVAPLTNLHCRQAVEYAVDKQSVQTAWAAPPRAARSRVP